MCNIYLPCSFGFGFGFEVGASVVDRYRQQGRYAFCSSPANFLFFFRFFRFFRFLLRVMISRGRLSCFGDQTMLCFGKLLWSPFVVGTKSVNPFRTKLECCVSAVWSFALYSSFVVFSPLQ